ncbi:MAG: SUMF1/EgtB/PvdO family nonheme iron enzyme [Nitrospinaceae bacterium]|jgi:formylglycine-generating enzyme required for sulfatase activity|nr:MAG: SUMF1/EgtB/PvdO family nonheme iron enzyme [Nitrospinaceae bacterium]
MKPRGVLALCLLLVSCESHTVEQIAVTVPPGVTVPDKMVYIPAGEFIMGHPDQPRTAGGRKVATGAYFIDRFEVSREEYNRENPVPAFNEKTASLPAANVTYDEAEAYCRKKGKRLPTETEWEKAARGTDGRKWPWSIYFDHPNDGFSGFLPEPVDKRKEWVSPFGVYGMGHNVWEWTSDWYAYGGQPADEKERFKVIRGGLLQTHLTIRFTPAYERNYIEPAAHYNFIGFRCAKDVG